MLFSRFFLLICFNLCCLFLESNVTRNSLLRFTNYFQCFFKIKYETLERRSNFFFMYTKSKTFFSTNFIFTFSKMYLYIFSHSTKKWKLFFLMNVFFFFVKLFYDAVCWLFLLWDSVQKKLILSRFFFKTNLNKYYLSNL